MLLNLALIVVSGWLIMVVPKGFMPEEDTGMIFGFSGLARCLVHGGSPTCSSGPPR